MLKKIIVIRHAETDFNVRKVIQGQLDTPLNENGLKQAQGLVDALAGQPIDKIYASDLTRTIQTAQPLASSRGLEIVKLPELRERNFGPFQGKAWSVVLNQEVENYAKLLDENQPDYTIGQAESQNQLYHRLDTFLIRLQQAPEENVAVVSHGSVSKIFFRALGLTELADYYSMTNTDFCILKKSQGRFVLVETTMKKCSQKQDLSETLELKIATEC